MAERLAKIASIIVTPMPYIPWCTPSLQKVGSTWPFVSLMLKAAATSNHMPCCSNGRISWLLCGSSLRSVHMMYGSDPNWLPLIKVWQLIGYFGLNLLGLRQLLIHHTTMHM